MRGRRDTLEHPPVGLAAESFLSCQSGPDTAWTTVNIAEAVPGVQVPLAWGVWSTAAERGLRRGFFDLGVLRRSEVEASEVVDERIMAIFSGYCAVSVDTFRMIADRTPGSSGDAIERQLFGSVRPGVTSRRTFRRYPVAMVKTPWTMVRLATRLAALGREIEPWWAASTAPEVLADLPGAAARFARATELFESAFSHHMSARMLGQGMYDEVAKLAAAAGRPGLELKLVTGYGSFDEAALVADLLDVSRGRSDLAAFVGRHGFHGPAEGDLTSSSWREDPRPIERLLDVYREHDDSAHPDASLAVQRAERQRAEAQLLDGLSRSGRVKARIVLRLTRKLIPLGEVGKTAFLMALDGLRAAARSQGRYLVARGVLERADDVFMLTPSEAFGCLPGNAAELAAQRRPIIEGFARIRLPQSWIGQPVPVEPDRDNERPSGDAATVTGIAASPGSVTGVARVIRDLDQLDEFEHGEILVCEMTDPSWTSYMFVASALVIDIGSPVSHGAILARELGIPCVINTRTGTRSIRTGEMVQVDGSTGTVTIQRPG